MATFALIAEGKTDQVILHKIIEEVCDDFFEEGVFVNYLQPLRDKSDSKHAPHAGWELVFEYCKESTKSALSTNDFVVIQIDTDCGDHQNYGLPLTQGGQDRPSPELIERAREILITHIGKETYDANSSRFIFAIAVHSLESWLLLYEFNINHAKNSFDRLSREIRRRHNTGHKKDVDSYQLIAKRIRLRNLKNFLEDDTSFGHFLRLLTLLAPTAESKDVDDGDPQSSPN